MCPPVPPARHEVPAAEPGVGAGDGAEGNPPISLVSPGRADFGGIKGSSSSSSDDSRTSRDSSDSGDLPALARKPTRDLVVFNNLLTLPSECTRYQSWSLTMSASCADALLTYALRAVEAKRTVEEEGA